METPLEREIRFAVVMYGGVSLAIYTSGVSQEFLHLVRATSSDAPTAVEAVYRELAEIVGARFAVDTISGTSAGGINAIFLGKALANGQSLDPVARLWLDEAEVGDLWNRAAHPRSLLDGPGLYDKLKVALDAMDDNARESSGHVLPHEVDVFVTATDIQGLELPLALSDMTVAERRHKNVFHLEFSRSRNDFERGMNPFLAFAARATSAFPFAFEPMRLADAGSMPDAGRFFPDYVQTAGVDYAARAFGDGGYLNNKPFRYAINALPHRILPCPADRKLAYIEPAPEPAMGNATQGPPGPLRNALDAAVTLHRYETIREDLEKILERNRLIERVREVVDHVEEDVRRWRASGMPAPGRREGHIYARRTVADEIRERGPGYGAYHRLKVRAVTDELAGMAAAAGFPGDSRKAVEEWRAHAYSEEDVHTSESLFLLHYDLGYRLRRIRFLLDKAGQAGGTGEMRARIQKIATTLEDLRRRSRESGGFHFRITGERTLDGFAKAVQEEFQIVMVRAGNELESCMQDHPLRRFFENYEYYDQVTFPIFYETGVGEPDTVEVFRISPLDAKSLVDEAADGGARKKLFGATLFHFGAFLRRDWRNNDMLWGRLDGAERIITSVLPAGSEHTARLVRAAHLAILREIPSGGEALYESLRNGPGVNPKIGWRAGLKLLWRTAFTAAKMGRAF